MDKGKITQFIDNILKHATGVKQEVTGLLLKDFKKNYPLYSEQQYMAEMELEYWDGIKKVVEETQDEAQIMEYLTSQFNHAMASVFYNKVKSGGIRGVIEALEVQFWKETCKSFDKMQKYAAGLPDIPYMPKG